MSGHYATLLRDTVQGLLPAHDVYVTDWKDAATIPLLDGGFDTDDYVEYIMDFMRQLGPNHHVMAVCQPAPLVIVAVALLAQWGEPVQPRSMTLMGGPIDTAAAPTAPAELAEERSMSWFETRCVTTVPRNYPAAHRRVYPGFLQLGAFIAMNADRHMNAHLRMFRHLVEGDGEAADAHRKFYDEYMSVMDITADFYLQTIRRVFKERWIATNQFVWRGEVVRPEAIRQTALLTVEGQLDDISAPGQTIAAQDICRAIPEYRRRQPLAEGRWSLRHFQWPPLARVHRSGSLQICSGDGGLALRSELWRRRRSRACSALGLCPAPPGMSSLSPTGGRTSSSPY